MPFARPPGLDEHSPAPLLPVEDIPPQVMQLLGIAQFAGGASGWKEALEIQSLKPDPYFMESFHRGIGAPDASQAQAMLRAWKRWVNYVDDDNQKLVRPTANDVAAYLARISKGGPTAARGAYAALFRFATQMRLEFHLDDELVAGWRATKPGHRSKQQVSLEPLEIFIFEYAVASGDE